MNKRCVVTGLLLAVAGAVAGCSSLDLGPEPSTYIGPRGRGPIMLTDPALEAVTPVVPGDTGKGALDMSTGEVPGQGANPQTMPAATQPTTTQPAATTNPGAQASSQPSPSRNALGQIVVPEDVNVQQAILIGLRNNTSLRVRRLDVPIQRTSEEAALAPFDTTVSGQISGGRKAFPRAGTSKGPTGYTDTISGNASVSKFLPTGTTLEGHINTDNAFYSDAASSTGVGVSITQSLLRGAGLDFNLASIRQAEVDTKITQFELRGYAEQLVADIENAYWNLAYAERRVVIVQNAMQFAQQQLDQTNAEIKVGKIAPTEEAASRAQLETEKEQLIAAKGALETSRLTFLQLITPAGVPFWNRTVTLKTLPFVPKGSMDPVDRHVAVALRLRPDINQARLEIQHNDLRIVQTRNGLLPRLDFFLNLDKTGYSHGFGTSITSLNGPDYSAVAGIEGSYPLENHAARAEYRRSVITREQSEEALRNLTQTIQVKVRSDYIIVEQNRQQIDATRATREARETALQVETAKFNAGRSYSLLVAQAQRDLLNAQLDEVKAVTDYLQSLVTLYFDEGSLLYRRGLDAPGGQPVEGVAWH